MEKLNKLLELWGLTIDEDNNMVHLAHSTKDLDVENDYREVFFQASYSLDSECLVIEYASDEMRIITHEKWSLAAFIEYLEDDDNYEWDDIFNDMYSWRSISDMDELFKDPQGYCDKYFNNSDNFIKVDVINW